MSFSTIIRRSLTKAKPFAGKLIGSQSATATTTALKRTTLYRPSLYSAGNRFCSTSSAVDTVYSDRKLLEVVEAEIDVALQSDDHGKIVYPPGDFPFIIEDNPGEQTVTLTREYDYETITVEVSMPNLVSEEDDNDDDEVDEDQQTDACVPLLVTIEKKDGKGPQLEFDCAAFPDEVRINGLSLKNPGTENELAYEGPDFLDLDENLQKAFHKYLEIRGIKPSTTNFLHEYMVEKDNKEYVRWLKDVKDFVKA